MCNITFCDVDSKVDQFFQPALYIIVIVLGLPTNCLALWAAYMQVRRGTHTHTRLSLRLCEYFTWTSILLPNPNPDPNLNLTSVHTLTSQLRPSL